MISIDCFSALLCCKPNCKQIFMSCANNGNIFQSLSFHFLLPRGSHSIVGPARVAIERINHNQYGWMPNKLLNVYFGARMNPATGSGDGWAMPGQAEKVKSWVGEIFYHLWQVAMYMNRSKELFVNGLPGWVAWRLGIARLLPETLQCNVACLVWRRIEHIWIETRSQAS